MGTREVFLERVWDDLNVVRDERWIDDRIAASERDPEAPFADVGPALERLLAVGASRRDLSLVARGAAYEQAISILRALKDTGIDDDGIERLDEELLGADPGGKEGRPGSAPDRGAGPGTVAGEPEATPRVKPARGSVRRKLLGRSERVCFSPDGALLATIGSGVILWRCPEIEELETIRALSDPSWLAFSPDSRRLAVKSTSGRIVLLGMPEGAERVDFRNQSDGEGGNPLFSDDGEHIIDGSWRGSHCARTLRGRLVFREAFPGDMVEGVLQHPDGRFWFRHSRRYDHEMLDWSMSIRLLGCAWPFEPGAFDRVDVPFPYSDAAFSPEGRHLAVLSGTLPAVLTLFSFPAMEHLRDVPLHLGGGPRLRIGYSPCGRFLAAVGSELVAVLDPSTLVPFEEIPIEDGCDVAFSPSGSLMAVGSSTAGEVFDTTRFLTATAGGWKDAP